MRRKSPKLEGGVLFVRVDAALLRALDRLLGKMRKAEPGATKTRSDLVRSVLWDRVKTEEET